MTSLLLLLFLDTSSRKTPAVTEFVVSFDDRVAVYDRAGKLRREVACRPYDARRLPGDRLLVAERSAGRVVIFDAKGAVEWEKTGLNSPVDADPLPGGGVLVLENGANRVIELDRGGRIVWEVGGLQNAYDADRLPNGHTLVADSGANRIAEFDRAGRVVREWKGLDFPNNVVRERGRTLYTTYTRGGVRELGGSWSGTVEGATLYSACPEGGDVWVADGRSGRILRLDRAGRIGTEIRLERSFVDVHFAR